MPGEEDKYLQHLEHAPEIWRHGFCPDNLESKRLVEDTEFLAAHQIQWARTLSQQLFNECPGNALAAKFIFHGKGGQLNRPVFVMLKLRTPNENPVRGIGDNKVSPIQIHGVDAHAANQTSYFQGV